MKDDVVPSPPPQAAPPSQHILPQLSLAAKLLGLDVRRGWDVVEGADLGDWAGIEALHVTGSCGCGSTLPPFGSAEHWWPM